MQVRTTFIIIDKKSILEYIPSQRYAWALEGSLVRDMYGLKRSNILASLVSQACKLDVVSAKCVFGFADPLSFFVEFSIMFLNFYRISQDFRPKLKHFDKFFSTPTMKPLNQCF